MDNNKWIRQMASGLVLLFGLGVIGTQALASEASDEDYDADSQATEVLAGGCAGCHGTDGQLSGQVPVIAGQPADELEAQLLRFKNDEAFATVMNRIAGGYTEEELRRLAQHFSAIGN